MGGSLGPFQYLFTDLFTIYGKSSFVLIRNSRIYVYTWMLRYKTTLPINWEIQIYYVHN